MKERIVFFDLETGGLDPAIHPVIQFAGVAVEDWEVVDELEVKLTFAEGKCSAQALSINSYDCEVWAEQAVAPDEAVRWIARFLRKHATVPMVSKRGKPWRACRLAGHNTENFDRAFLARLFDQAEEFCVGTIQTLDTLQLALWITSTWPADARPKDFKLGTLCQDFDIALDGAHDALADVRATVALARELVFRITEN